MPFKKGDKPPKSAAAGKRKQEKTLSLRQGKMLDAYYGPSNFCKTDALRRAGYKHPDGQHNKFNLPKVKEEMERREAEVRDRYEVTHERIMGELARIAFSSIRDLAHVDDDGNLIIDPQTLGQASPDDLRALGEVTVETYVEGKGDQAREVKRIKVKPWPKLQALDQLMRHGGLSKEKSPFEGVADLVDRINAGMRRASSD